MTVAILFTIHWELYPLEGSLNAQPYVSSFIGTFWDMFLERLIIVYQKIWWGLSDFQNTYEKKPLLSASQWKLFHLTTKQFPVTAFHPILHHLEAGYFVACITKKAMNSGRIPDYRVLRDKTKIWEKENFENCEQNSQWGVLYSPWSIITLALLTIVNIVERTMYSTELPSE